jgi:diguanylate cyclase (GGDEF)-like protein
VCAKAQNHVKLLLWTLALLYVISHGIAATCLPERLSPLSTLLIVLVELAAIAFSLHHSFKVDRSARGLWWLLASAILFHSLAMSLDTIAEATGVPVFDHVPRLSIFFSMLYGIPLLAAVSMQLDRQIRSIAQITYVLLSLALGILLYVQLFSLLSIHGSTNPGDVVLISRLFDGLDLFLALAATTRWSGAEHQSERAFFRIASIFLWINAIFPAIHNRILIHHDYVWLDLLISIPYVVLVVLIGTEQQHPARRPSPRIVHLVQGGSPIFLSVALLVIGFIASRTHFFLGLTAGLLSVTGYGLLNILSQSQGRETEEWLRTSNKVLEELAGLDGLTGIPNRRVFDDVLDRECAIAQRTMQPVSLLMIDVDYFKQLNDTEGHLVGDRCLIRIAAALRAALPRSTDFVGRYGGEEFAAILPATNQTGATEVALNLCRAVADLRLNHPTSAIGTVTISIGFSTFDGSPQQSAVSLALAADWALYEAKHLGRNRSECCSIDLVKA